MGYTKNRPVGLDFGNLVQVANDTKIKFHSNLNLNQNKFNNLPSMIFTDKNIIDGKLLNIKIYIEFQRKFI